MELLLHINKTTMTPQEAAYHEFMKPIRKLELVNEMEDQAFYNLFQAGAKWQSEQDNQALSSALKEIAELHAKVKDLQEALNSVCTKVERSTTLMIYTEPDVEAEINKSRKLLSI